MHGVNQDGECPLAFQSAGLPKAEYTFHKAVAFLHSGSKASLCCGELEREDIIQSRNDWKQFQHSIDSSRLVFLDESGLKTNMTRLYGRAFQGERCHDTTPCGQWETTTIRSSVRLDGTTESVLFEGAVDRKMFEAYIKDMLVPQLRPGDILIMDNLSAHKSEHVVTLVQSVNLGMITADDAQGWFESCGYV